MEPVFKCQRCGNCCRIRGYVHITESETDAIAKFLEMDVATFIDTYTVLAPNRKGLVLKDQSNGACIMLTEDGLCHIQPVKPKQCSDFPYSWTNHNSEDICPGLAELQASKARSE